MLLTRFCPEERRKEQNTAEKYYSKDYSRSSVFSRQSDSQSNKKKEESSFSFSESKQFKPSRMKLDSGSFVISPLR